MSGTKTVPDLLGFFDPVTPTFHNHGVIPMENVQ